MIRSTANKASPNRMIEPNLSGSNHAPTKLIDKAETAQAMARRLAALIKKNLARRRRSCWSVCRRLAMVGVVMRSSWKCDCRRVAVGPTNDPAVISPCCQSPCCHQESDAGRFQSCHDYQTNCASNVTPNSPQLSHLPDRRARLTNVVFDAGRVPSANLRY